ncbi:MAG: class I SAM-dependent methyltransferase [Actinomycetota bacterium]
MAMSNPSVNSGIKAKHRAMWALGDYPAVATEVIPALGTALVEASGIQKGDRVLDIAAGSGNAAIPAAQAGAQVTAADLTPELFEQGRRLAERAGVSVEWQEADAEDLPFGDGSFDAAISCVGIMFAPNHQASAGEMVRVLRPGGTIALANWTPEGFVGQMFATMKPYAPPPPPGAQPPPLWGNQQHVVDLLGDRATDVVARREKLTVDRFGSAEEFRDFFKACYGPTINTYRNIAEDPDRVQALDQDLVELAHRHDLGDGRMEWEYLLLTARKK